MKDWKIWRKKPKTPWFACEFNYMNMLVHQHDVLYTQILKSPQVLRFVGHVCLHSPLTVSLGEALEEEGAEYMRSFPISVTQHVQEEIPRNEHILIILKTNFYSHVEIFTRFARAFSSRISSIPLGAITTPLYTRFTVT